MDLNHTNIDTFPLWKDLSSLKVKERYQKTLEFGPVKINILHNQFNDVVFQKIAQLSDLRGLNLARSNWLKGEDLRGLPGYCYLRRFKDNSFKIADVEFMRKQMKKISEQINQNSWTGYSNKPMTDIVNIGIGGSDLGPKFYYEALKNLQINHQVNCHFISDADYYSVHDCLKKLNPETTLFIISSKSFNTEETLINADLAQKWINHPDAFKKHFIVVTSNTQKAMSLGYKHIVTLGNWVVGRYSISSAINLINAIMLGYDNYIEFLKGAEEMDQHFLSAAVKDNLPINLAFIGIWNINFLKIQTQLMLLYHSKLKYFCDYVQQLDMESNGKSYDKNGNLVNYSTGPIIWGGLGNQSQHSYYQLLAQGSHEIAIDFFSVRDIKNDYMNHLCHKRKSGLFNGVTSKEKIYAINQQSSLNHIELSEISPKSIGALISLYEHKIFTQAWVWNINPFDQPGVESAKGLLMA